MRRGLLQFVAHRAVDGGIADPELADDVGEQRCLLRQRMAGCGRFFDHRRVLLRHLIHLVDRGIDLGKARFLLVRAGGESRFDDLLWSKGAYLPKTGAGRKPGIVKRSYVRAPPCYVTAVAG